MLRIRTRRKLKNFNGGNEKMKKPIGTNKNFVYHDKIGFDLGKNNHLNSNFNKNKEFEMKRNENKFIKEFKQNFSLDEKKTLFTK